MDEELILLNKGLSFKGKGLENNQCPTAVYEADRAAVSLSAT